MIEPKPVPIRERTRRLAQTELTSVAQDLFLAQGYEDTTVDQIAAAAGALARGDGGGGSAAAPPA